MIFLILLLILTVFPLDAALSSVQANALAQQANGQIVSADTATLSTTQQMWVIRYNTDGSFDSSFGASQNGIVIPAIGTLSVATGIGVQSTGDVIAGGYAAIGGIAEFAVAAYTSSGVLDTSFGVSANGIVTQLIGSACAANALAIQSNNSVVQAGVAIVSGTPEFALLRLTSAGLVDGSFGSGGIVTTPIPSASAAAIQALVIQSNGAIVAAGWAIIGGVQQFALARYTTSGALDATFGTGGIVTQAIGSSTQGYAVALDGSGNVLIGGASNGSFAIARFTSAGVLDSTFGTGGIVTTPIGTNARINSLLIQASGSIVAVGNSDANGALARYTSAGVLDNTFGSGGIIVSQLPQPVTANAAIIKSNTNLLIAGSIEQNALMLGLSGNGIPDTTWGIQGFVYMPGGIYLGQSTLIYDQEAQGTSGGTFTSGAWQPRMLNTILDGTQNVSLLSNQIILQRGSFEIEIIAPAYKVGSHQIRLQDVTHGVTLAYGTTSSADTGSQTMTTSRINKQVLISGLTALQVQHQCQTTEPTDGFGLAANFGPEIYAMVKVTQKV